MGKKKKTESPDSMRC